MADRSASQNKILITIGLGGAALVFGAMYFFGGGNAVQAKRSAATDIESSVLEGVRRSADPEEIWIRQSENSLREMRQQIQQLQKTNDALRDQVAAQIKSEDDIVAEIGESVNATITRLAERVQAAESRAEVAESEVASLSRSLQTVQSDLADGERRRDADARARPEPAGFTVGQGENEFVAANRQAQRTSAAGSREVSEAARPAPTPAPAFVNFSLEGDRDTRRKITDYLPAGSYAPAVVLSGVDASAGVENAADPRPVLLRVTGPATTAATGGGEGQQVDITGCVITAEAVGDLSSERVFPRLISMTCSPEEDVIVETQVHGFVAGQGKAGVRGRVVSREGDLVQNAAIAGAFSGLAGVVGDIGATATGDVTSDETLQGLDTILGRGLIDAGGKGAGAAFDRLAQYYIQRAEQYQPVISLYGGASVEVVFLKGVAIND